MPGTSIPFHQHDTAKIRDSSIISDGGESLSLGAQTVMGMTWNELGRWPSGDSFPYHHGLREDLVS